MLTRGTLDRPQHLDSAIQAQERRVAARPADALALNDLGNLLTLAGAALSALLARGIYRLSPAAWWATTSASLA